MKTVTVHLKQNLQVYIVLVCVICMPYTAFGIESIATIGQPTPVKHAFLDNSTIVRVVPTHIEIVDANTGEIIDKFGQFEDLYWSDVVFSPNASHIAVETHSRDTKIRSVTIWDVNTREQVNKWDMEGSFSVAAFSPTQPILATSIDDEIYLWNWQSGELIGRMVGDRRPADTCYYVDGRWRTCRSPVRDIALVFSPAGQYLIVASMRPDIELWNVETQQLEGHIEGHIGNWVHGVTVSPDGTYIASYDSEQYMIYLWNMKSRQLLWKTQRKFARTTDMAFSPDSQHLYVTTSTSGWSLSGRGPWQGWDVKVRVWDVKSGQQIDSFETEFKGLGSIEISPDGKKALLLYADGEILWDITNKRIDRMWVDYLASWPSTGLDDVVLSPDGKTVIAISRHFIKSWDVASQEMGLLVSAENYNFNAVTISPDSQKFAVGKEPIIEIRDIETGEIETQFPHYISLPEKLVFSSSGRWLAVKDHWGRTDILDAEFPEKKQRLTPPLNVQLGSSYQIGFSENEEYFATSGRTKIDDNNYKYWILLWKREGDTFGYQYAWPGGFASAPAFLRTTDGSTVLVGTSIVGIHIWKILPDAPELLSTLNSDYPIQFSRDGRYLFTRQDDKFQIWDWQSSRLRNEISIQWFRSMNKDKSLLLTYNSQGQYQIWDLSHILSFLPYSVESKDKKFVTLGQIKRDQLLQNFPNPFNPETWIPFRLADESDVTICIWTPTGKLVRTLSLGKMAAGDYSSQTKAIHWDGRNDKGEPISSGVYMYTINTKDFSATRKMLIMK